MSGYGDILTSKPVTVVLMTGQTSEIAYLPSKLLQRCSCPKSEVIIVHDVSRTTFEDLVTCLLEPERGDGECFGLGYSGKSSSVDLLRLAMQFKYYDLIWSIYFQDAQNGDLNISDYDLYPKYVLGTFIHTCCMNDNTLKLMNLIIKERPEYAQKIATLLAVVKSYVKIPDINVDDKLVERISGRLELEWKVRKPGDQKMEWTTFSAYRGQDLYDQLTRN